MVDMVFRGVQLMTILLVMGLIPTEAVHLGHGRCNYNAGISRSYMATGRVSTLERGERWSRLYRRDCPIDICVSRTSAVQPPTSSGFPHPTAPTSSSPHIHTRLHIHHRTHHITRKISLAPFRACGWSSVLSARGLSYSSAGPAGNSERKTGSSQLTRARAHNRRYSLPSTPSRRAHPSLN